EDLLGALFLPPVDADLRLRTDIFHLNKHQTTFCPLSTKMHSPVMRGLLTRNRSVSVMSFRPAGLPSGSVAALAATSASVGCASEVNSVPGQMPFTRMCGASAFAAMAVNSNSAFLLSR